MAFMTPEYTDEPFHTGDNQFGEGTAIPSDVYGTLEQFIEECEIRPDTASLVTGKWWARLSASGYMDATDWSGPFDTLAEARSEIERVYDVDSDTGEELDGES